MKDILSILKEVGAILGPDHFVGTSGRHFDTYINKDKLFPHTTAASKVGELFALKYQDREIDVVVAPALGGIVLSQWTAHHLSHLKDKEILGIYTEKDAQKNQVLMRAYDSLVCGKKVLVIEDLTTTGGSIKKVVDRVRQAGGIIVEACVMVNKDPERVNEVSVGAPFSFLAEFRVTSYEASQCPLCAQGIPVNTSVGHGKK